MSAAPGTETQEPANASVATFCVVRVLCEQPSGATLFVCIDRSVGEQVVVKSLTKHVKKHDPKDTAVASRDTSDEPLVLVNRRQDSFDQELRVARVLMTQPHPNIVRFSQPPPSLAKHSLVMEFCPRGDLLSLLDSLPGQCLDEISALAYFRGIIDGVAHLHSLDIAHRDLSLENVLLDAQGRAKICDFGLSTRASIPARECVGKLQYMAPEVVSGLQSYDPILADVWSLGIMLFIMLTGSSLFHLAVPSDPAWRPLKSVGISGILRSWGMRDRLSEQTIMLLSDMLRTDPAQRCQSLDHVRSRL